MGRVALVGKITHVPSMYLSELDGPRKAIIDLLSRAAAQETSRYIDNR